MQLINILLGVCFCAWWGDCCDRGLQAVQPVDLSNTTHDLPAVSDTIYELAGLQGLYYRNHDVHDTSTVLAACKLSLFLPPSCRVLPMQVPQVYWQYSTPEVLVLEYCPGIKINDGAALDAKGLDRQRLARLAVESYLQQILNYGFFHAGNLSSSAMDRLIHL